METGPASSNGARSQEGFRIECGVLGNLGFLALKLDGGGLGVTMVVGSAPDIRLSVGALSSCRGAERCRFSSDAHLHDLCSLRAVLTSIHSQTVFFFLGPGPYKLYKLPTLNLTWASLWALLLRCRAAG